MSKHDYDVVVAPPTFTVLTVVPYIDGPEYREYTVPSDELPTFLAEMADTRAAYEDVDGDGVREGLTRAEELLGMEDADE